MQSDPTIIGKIYSRVTARVRQLDEALIAQFEPAINNIDQLRFDFFKKCVNDRHDAAACFKEAERMELRPDFEGAAKTLQECVNKAAGGTQWEKGGEACLVAYQRRLRSELQGQINRVLKSL